MDFGDVTEDDDDEEVPKKVIVWHPLVAWVSVLSHKKGEAATDAATIDDDEMKLQILHVVNKGMGASCMYKLPGHSSNAYCVAFFGDPEKHIDPNSAHSIR